MKALELLVKFHNKAKAATGMDTDIADYMAALPVETKNVGPAPGAFAPLEANFLDIEGIAEGLSECTLETARRDIRNCRAHPTQFVELCRETLKAMSKVSTTSLTVMTSLEPAGDTSDLMNDFTHAFDLLVSDIERLTEQPISVKMLAAHREVTRPAKKGFWNSLWALEDEPQDLKSIAVRAEECAECLRDLVPHLQSMACTVGVEVRTTATVIDTFEKIKERLKIYSDAGEDISVEWREEAKTKSTGPEELAEPFHLRALDEQMRYLHSAFERVSSHSGSHIVHAELLQRQVQKLTIILEQHLPLLVATVEGFGRQLSLSKAGSRDPKGTMQGIKAIDNQSEQLVHLLGDLDQAADQVRSHMGELFLDRALGSPSKSLGAGPKSGPSSQPS